MFDAARKVLIEGFFPAVPTDRLRGLLFLVLNDDPRLIQGSTCFPPPLMATEGENVESVDPVAFLSVDNALTLTVGEVEEAFAKACFDMDSRLGEPAACRWLLNATDDYSRKEVWDFWATELQKELHSRLMKDKAITHLRPEQQEAMKLFPNDETLKMAMVDQLLEDGREDLAEALRR